MRRITSLGIATMGLVALALASANAGPSLLFDVKTGQIIESDSPFARWYPASLTKLMTTYVAFRAVQSGEVTLLSPVRMSRAAANEPPSKMGYQPGTVLTLDNALKIIMVKSANDVAAAIGESLGGSMSGFAERMNAEAQRLGMTGSHWVNAHGLHDDNQYTTARDLGMLASALRREFPQYASYFSIEGLSFGKQVIPSHNGLVGRFEGADGMKTGYTCPSGYNLVASATRNGRTLMAVVIGATSVRSRTDAAAAMLERGFAATAAGPLTLATLQPSGSGQTEAMNMRADLCTKAGSAALRKRERELQAKLKKEGKAQTQAVALLAKRTQPRQLVAISLGGATGPATAAVAAAFREEAILAAANAELARQQVALARENAALTKGSAVVSGKEAVLAEGDEGVPLPTWRPDLPPPAGTEPLMTQGDSSASAK
jgi:D-alanyl-D-alanine carboxypeptidase